jgi:hypothetical protein
MDEAGVSIGYRAEKLEGDESLDHINHLLVHKEEEGWQPIFMNEEKIVMERWRDVFVTDNPNEPVQEKRYTKRILRPISIYSKDRPDLQLDELFTLIMAHLDGDEKFCPGEFIELLDLTMDPWMLGRVMFIQNAYFREIGKHIVQRSLAARCGLIPKTATIDVIQSGLFRLLNGGEITMESKATVLGIRIVELYI